MQSAALDDACYAGETWLGADAALEARTRRADVPRLLVATNAELTPAPSVAYIAARLACTYAINHAVCDAVASLPAYLVPCGCCRLSICPATASSRGRLLRLQRKSSLHLGNIRPHARTCATFAGDYDPPPFASPADGEALKNAGIGHQRQSLSAASFRKATWCVAEAIRNGHRACTASMLDDNERNNRLSCSSSKPVLTTTAAQSGVLGPIGLLRTAGKTA